MGKNRHSKDRLFITATEWATDYGGKKASRSDTCRPLPFDHCALTLAPFLNPVLLGKNSGVIFDFENIVPYLQQHKSDPVSGEVMTTKDIIKLNMEKNNDQEWHCPITNKVFTNSSHIVAISTTGNVYSFNAVNELNIKAKNFTDLISGQSFTKKDIITLQDPQNAEQLAKRDINNFAHLKVVRQESLESRKSECKIRSTLATTNVMKAIDDHRIAEKESGIKRKTTEEIITSCNSRSSAEDNEDVAEFLSMDPITTDVNPGQVNTDGRASSALTSSSSTMWTSNATRLANADEIREARWKIMRQIGKKGYVQIQTTLGNLNIEVHCDIAPRTAWNFITLCQRGYYDDTPLHRLVKGFMIQGGDPTGKGSGGKSAFGKQGATFRDEFDTRILHTSRGVVSMANCGQNTNTSQFFILFQSASHLDLKHAVFGRTVGGLAVLDKIEEVGADKKERPLSEIKIVKALVISSPIEEANDLLSQFIQTNMRSRLSIRQTAALPRADSSVNESTSKIRKLN